MTVALTADCCGVIGRDPVGSPSFRVQKKERGKRKRKIKTPRQTDAQTHRDTIRDTVADTAAENRQKYRHDAGTSVKQVFLARCTLARSTPARTSWYSTYSSLGCCWQRVRR